MKLPLSQMPENTKLPMCVTNKDYEIMKLLLIK